MQQVHLDQVAEVVVMKAPMKLQVTEAGIVSNNAQSRRDRIGLDLCVCGSDDGGKIKEEGQLPRARAGTHKKDDGINDKQKRKRKPLTDPKKTINTKKTTER